MTSLHSDDCDPQPDGHFPWRSLALVFAIVAAALIVFDLFALPVSEEEKQARIKKIWDGCAPAARLNYPECDVVRSGKIKGTWPD